MTESRNNPVPWINVATGILAIISAWVVAPSASGTRWDVAITGLVIAIIGLITMGAHGRTRNNYWPVINTLAGIWLLISISFASGDLAMTWSNVVLGVVTIVTSLVSIAYEKQTTSAGETSLSR